MIAITYETTEGRNRLCFSKDNDERTRAINYAADLARDNPDYRDVTVHIIKDTNAAWEQLL